MIMIKQQQLSFKIGLSKEVITARSGLALYSEFLRSFGIKELIDTFMPKPDSKRHLNLINMKNTHYFQTPRLSLLINKMQ
ncbi:MAG: hypothetical protein SNJ53_09175 [Thermodesulfovibrionales bacterium]